MGWNTFSPPHTRKSLLWIHRPPCKLSGDQAGLPYNSRFHNGSVEINIWMPDNSALPIPKLSWKFPSSSNSAVGKILKERCGEPKDWQLSSNTEVSVGCSCERQIAKDPRILSQLGYLCGLSAVIKMSLHPSILLVPLLSGAVPEQKAIRLLHFLPFRAWSASKDPSVVFQINASWWGWPEFTFLSSAPPAWVHTLEEEQRCPRASWTTIAESPAAPLLEPPAVGAEAGKGI